jgi:hypothetical protein
VTQQVLLRLVQVAAQGSKELLLGRTRRVGGANKLSEDGVVDDVGSASREFFAEFSEQVWGRVLGEVRIGDEAGSEQLGLDRVGDLAVVAASRCLLGIEETGFCDLAESGIQVENGAALKVRERSELGVTDASEKRDGGQRLVGVVGDA